jgi:hypothetical protein
VSAIVEELRLLATWGERHRRLGTRLLVVLALSVVVDIAGMVATYFFERGVKGGEIHTLWDAFFFSTVQLLTVSSQISNPFTLGGRIVDIGLELWAVLVVAGSAGAIAAFFQSADRRP